MKLYGMVRLYDGLVSDMQIFTSYKDMKKYCDEAVENEEVTYQDTSYYPEIDSEYTYLSNNFDKERHSVEIVIWPIQVKGIKLEE